MTSFVRIKKNIYFLIERLNIMVAVKMMRGIDKRGSKTFENCFYGCLSTAGLKHQSKKECFTSNFRKKIKQLMHKYTEIPWKRKSSGGGGGGDY